MRRPKPTSGSDEPTPRRQTFPGLSDALDRLREVASDHPELDEVTQRLHSLAALSPLLHWSSQRLRPSLSDEAVRVLGRQARALRESLGLTRAQVATPAGVNDSSVRSFETGRHRTCDRLLGALLAALLGCADRQGLWPPYVAALRSVLDHVTVGNPGSPTPSQPILEETRPMQLDETSPRSNASCEPWGAWVRRRREGVAMPWQQLALRARVLPSELKGIESGHLEATAPQRRRITEALDAAEAIPTR